MPGSLNIPGFLVSPHRFGVSEEECGLEFPSDRCFDGAQQQLYRGVSIGAPAALIYAWLCQMRRAPYSYDWIDNLGRKSPRVRDDSLVNTACGDRFMYIFTLSDFKSELFLSLRTNIARWFIAQLYIDYVIISNSDEKSNRLLVKLNIEYVNGILGAFAKLLLPFGDAIMMAKQLKVFREYAEEDARLLMR